MLSRLTARKLCVILTSYRNEQRQQQMVGQKMNASEIVETVMNDHDQVTLQGALNALADGEYLASIGATDEAEVDAAYGEIQKDLGVYLRLAAENGKYTFEGREFAALGAPDISQHLPLGHEDGEIAYSVGAMRDDGKEFVLRWVFDDATIPADEYDWEDVSDAIPA